MATKTTKTKTSGTVKSAAKPRASAAAVRKPAVTKSVPKSVPAAGSAKSGKKKEIALFIDLDNTNASLTNVLEIISILRNYGRIVYGKLYGYTDAAAAEFAGAIQENSLETAGKLRFKSDGVSVVDTRLLFEAVSMTQKNKFNFAFIWTGVGELIPLFSRLKELNCTTMTVDIPEFDCENKFVDQKIHLYSDYKFASSRPTTYTPPRVTPMSNPYTPPMPQASSNASQPTAPLSQHDESSPQINSPILDDLIAGAPVLPRKKGAPELGSTENVKIDTSTEEDEGMTEEESNEFYMGLVSNVLENVKRAATEEKLGAEMAELTDAPPEPDENAFDDDMSVTPDLPDLPDIPAEQPAHEKKKKHKGGDDKTDTHANDSAGELSDVPSGDAAETAADEPDARDLPELAKVEKMSYDDGGYDFSSSPVIDDKVYEPTSNSNDFTAMDSDFGSLSDVPDGKGN